MKDIKEKDIVGVWMNMKNHLRTVDGIFDYNSSNNNCFNVLVMKKSFIVRNIKNNKIKYYKQQGEIPRDEKILFKINYFQDNPKIEKAIFKSNLEQNEKEINSINEYIWYVINSVESNGINKNEDYYLSENDILKFGKVKYIVKEIHIENKTNNINNNINMYNNAKIFKTNYICEEYKKCEFCDDLMVRLCKCEDYEHIKCIKDWINDRFIERESDNKLVKSYYFSIFQCKEYIKRNCNEENCENENCCKKCNTYYPLYFTLAQKKNTSKEEKKEQKEEKKYIEFYEIKKPEKCDYLILESLPHIDKTSNSPKIEKDIHIIKLTGKDINIGSGQNNDVVIHDKSVCKMHSVIKHDKYNGKLLIKNKSKRAGTLVLIKNKIVDLSEKEKYFQVDKTFFSARLIKKEEIKNLIKDLKEDEDVKIIEL